MTSVTIQHFHEDIEAAEQAAATGPVIIMEDGAAKRVLLTIEDYRRMLHVRILEGVATEADYSDYKAAGGTISPGGKHQDLALANTLAVQDDEYFDWKPERPSFPSRSCDPEEDSAATPAQNRAPRTMLDVFCDPALTALPDDFEFPRLSFSARPADLS